MQAFGEIKEKYSSYAEIYTNGSKAETHVGCAADGAGWERARRLDSRASEYTSEVYGILMVLGLIIDHKLSQSIVVQT